MVQNKRKIKPFYLLNKLFIGPSHKGFVYADKMTNLIMRNGHKAKASKILLSALTSMHLKGAGSYTCKFDMLQAAVTNVMPFVEVRKVKVRGTTHMVPSHISEARQSALALRWLVQAARDMRKTSSMNYAECLAVVLTDALKSQGAARHKRDTLHKMAEANRSSAFYRWW
uniref:Ribosomal protein S7 n=1 Tax=Chloroparvula japonica TaxID=1411623 RepID=A0A4D6C514_9CHLO|nr:ribosomal protein S7 [Chloroparvula japonica]QBX98792.1 ribosomal protein S7 [Chloroparvula japonica]